MGRIDDIIRPAWRGGPVAWGLAAAVALLLAGGFLMQSLQPNPDDVLLAGNVPKPAEMSAVAVVLGGSPEAGHAEGAYLKAGVIAQSEGWITLQTFKGVSVTLDAPFEAALSGDDRIRLNKGRARVHVPPGAEGFRLESPAFEVVDLGTEFAAKVNTDGTGTCRVFEGKADVLLLDSMGESKKARRLTASESVRIVPSHEALQVIQEKDGDYPSMKHAPRPTLRLTPSYPADVMELAPAGYWRFESITGGHVPNEVPGGCQMLAAGSAAIAAENAGNHSGELTRLDHAEFFKIQGGTKAMFEGDFTVSFFTQFSWLQNFAMISAMRYDDSIKGHPLILQCYADLGKRGIKGSVLHAEFRDPPAWNGGAEIFGPALLRPLHWHHIAATRANGMVALYLDGAPVARKTVGSMPLDCREIFVGRLNGNARQSRNEARGLVGHIDELAVFPRALADGEIRRLGIPGLIAE
jgi:Concanavalin A-like lectin/glucanases superfamily/FecR protein